MTDYDKDGNLIWDDLFPDGRVVFYEGKDPKGFAAEMKAKFGFDLSENNPHWSKYYGYSFHCPGRCINQVYGSSKYPLGS